MPPQSKMVRLLNTRQIYTAANFSFQQKRYYTHKKIRNMKYTELNMELTIIKTEVNELIKLHYKTEKYTMEYPILMSYALHIHDRLSDFKNLN